MRILIHDASVLIDLISVDLLDSALTLPYEMETTDLVRHEIVYDGQEDVLVKMVEAKKLQVIRSSKEDIFRMAEIHYRNPALSLADCSVLFHAAAKDAVVLSGDARLRRTAEERSLTVHGTLWVMSELVANEIMTGADAALVLERLMEMNRRLPIAECRKFLANWRSR
jgi:hypothetical protein